jgi:hypothetical protein
MFSFALGRGFGREASVVVGVDAGLLLLTLARVVCELDFLSLLATVRGGTSFLCRWYWVGAGLLLLTLARVVSWLYFLSLLAPVRGGTSFLGPSATKKRSKENAFQQSVLSVPSVQATAFGSRVERCSLELRMFETLLLANSYISTLRHQCARARTMARRNCTA